MNEGDNETERELHEASQTIADLTEALSDVRSELENARAWSALWRRKATHLRFARKIRNIIRKSYIDILAGELDTTRQSRRRLVAALRESRARNDLLEIKSVLSNKV